MKSVAISVLAAALLLCLDCAPILAAETPTPNTGAIAPAGLIIVDTVADQMSTDGMCSLREAFSAANLDAQVDACPAGMGDDTIILPEGRYVLRLAGAGEDDNATGDLDLRSNVTIIGAGSGLTIIDGGGIDRVLDIHAGARLAMFGVTITNGATPDGKDDPVAGGGNADPGGGIRNAGDIWLLGCHVTGNRAGNGGLGGSGYPTVPGGTGGDGGGIYNRGNLTVQLSEIAQNAAGDGGRSRLELPCMISNQGGNGGGIWNDGTLVSTDSTITANRAGRGPGGGTGGGVWNSGTLVSTNSTITANQAGLGLGGGGTGGGVWNSGTLTITHATISANLAGHARLGGAGGSGGGISNTGRLSLSHSTMSANRAGDGSPADHYCSWDLGSGGDGGAIFNSGWLSVSNCTLSGNRAGDGGIGDGYVCPLDAVGPGGRGGGILNGGTALLEYGTISANTSGRLGSGYHLADPGGDGGGIVNGEGGQVTVKGLLLADNTAARNGPDCIGVLTSQGYNLIQDVGSCTLAGDLTGNVVGQAARLSPLADNGGLTWTHALRSDSPAIDRTDCHNLEGVPITIDQRDMPRPMGGACDIGAYERKPTWYLPLIER